MVYVLTLITQKSLLPFAFRRANGSMSRKDNGKEVREWVQSSFKLHRNIPTKSSKKRNCSNIISITSLHISKSHVCSFSDQNEVLGQLSPLRTQRSVITTWPTQPLTSLYSFHKKQERFPGHLVIWDRESKPACMLKKPPKSTVLLSIQWLDHHKLKT